jgi:hypothetical protein
MNQDQWDDVVYGVLGLIAVVLTWAAWYLAHLSS